MPKETIRPMAEHVESGGAVLVFRWTRDRHAQLGVVGDREVWVDLDARAAARIAKVARRIARAV